VLSAVVASLVAAAIQVALQLVNALVRNRLVFTSRDVVWMAPLSWLAFGLVVAIPLALLALATPRLNWRAISLGVYVAGGVLLLLAPYDALARWAVALLGVGLGVQLARLLPVNAPRWPRTLRRTALVLLAAFGLLTAAGWGWSAIAERRAIAALAPADPAAPNVLLVVFDVVRAANVSAYGYPRPTAPVLEQMSREGVRFERAFATAPWTLPSHASMFTGRYPTELTAGYRRALEDGPVTIAELLSARGYRTAGFTANEVYTGWDARLHRGFQRWSDYQRTLAQVRYSGLPWQTSTVGELWRARSLRDVWVAVRYVPLRVPTNLSFDLKRGGTVSRDFLAWEKGLADDRPFFAFLNYFDAHRPRYAPPDIQAQFTGQRMQLDRYDGAIAFIDRELGMVLDSLRARGRLDNTIVAVVGDHGELLGEHRFVGHSNTVYRDVLWVPFLLRYPPRLAGGTTHAPPVSLRDLGATLLDLAGTKASDPGLSGTSLVAALADTADPAVSPVFSYAQRGENLDPRFPNASGPLYSLVLDSLHYLRHPREEHLFNLVRDGAELHDLAGDPRFAAPLARARRVVDSLVALGVRSR
jgi:arylsulfatase A-like enzyme